MPQLRSSDVGQTSIFSQNWLIFERSNKTRFSVLLDGSKGTPRNWHLVSSRASSG